MKINRKLIAAFAMMSVAFAACTSTTPDVDCGEKPEMPQPVDVVWYEGGSSTSSLAVVWDAAPAINAGATSFTVQLLKTVDETPDPYGSSSVVVMASTNYEGSLNVTEEDAKKDPCDQGVFSNLVKGKCYYVRVRANYPNSVFSPWAFCSKDGEPARIKIGKGYVPANEEEDKTAPTAKIAYKDATGAIVTWSTFNWGNHAADFAMGYTLAINKGNDLVVKWHIPASSDIWTEYAKEGCRFYISGLDPETEYTATVTNVTDGVAADPVKFSTDKSKVVELPSTPAAAGDIILHEDFSMLLITGDLSRYAAGYSYDKRSESDSSWKATGDNPVATQTEWGCYLVDPSTEVGCFNTIKGVVATSRLKTWGMMAEDDTKGAICARPGYLKMGASSKCAWIVTPELACLAQPAKVELSFDAALYQTDPRTCIVEVLSGCTQEEVNNFVRPADRFTAATFEVGAVAGEWANYTFTIDNVMPGQRIAIGADRNGVDGQHRFYIDNIQVKVLSYGQLTLTAPANLALTATDTTIEASWDAVANSKEYVVEYKAKSATDWTALAPVAETKVLIEGLTFETEYEVRVKATADDVASDYSEVATIKTLAEIKKLGTPVVSETLGGLGFAFVTIAPVTNATGYEVYSGETKLESVVALETAEKVVLCAGGLGFEAAYALKVKAVAEGVEASDLSAEATGTTGKIWQNTDNVGPTTLSISWTDLIPGGGNDKRAYAVQVATDEAMTNLVYDVYCRDGQANSVTSFASTSWYGKKDNSNITAPTAATFGQLKPETTYYFRVKTVALGDVKSNGVAMNFPMGASVWSPVASYKTEAKHVAAANEVIFQGFDDITLQVDMINYAAGTTPLIADKAAVENPHNFVTEDHWSLYPATTSHLLKTWGYAAAGPFVNGNDKYVDEIENYVGTAKAGSLEGWHMSDSVSPHQGYVKMGAGSETYNYISTPVLNSSLLAAAGTPCVISFKACAVVTDEPVIGVEIGHAGTFTEIKEFNLPMACSEYTDGKNYVYDGKWTTYTVEATLAPGDNVIIRCKSKRFVIDDIAIVTK
ncbi:MAG: fibronectin type III domain-containing protein [Alistipes sp.]|nr:fibronectin type III domain-containing protein [Alistipes sp.]